MRQRQTAEGITDVVDFKDKSRSLCAGKIRWEILIGYVNQCSQVINFDCWTLVCNLRDESLAK